MRRIVCSNSMAHLFVCVDFLLLSSGNNQIVLSNTILLNGGVDPVHPMGNYNSGPGTLTRLIPGTAHCADLMLPQMTDPQQLTQARVDAVEMMKTWWTSAWEEEAKGAAASTAAAPPTTYISFFKNDSDCTASPALYTLPFSSGACITSPTSWSVTWPYFSIKLSTYNRYLLSLHYAADCSDLTQETWVDGQGNQCNLNSYAPTYAFSITTPLVDPYIWTIYNEDNCTGGVFTTTGVAVGVCVPNLLPQEQSVIFSLSGQTWTYQEYTWVDTCAGHASNQEQALLGQCSAYGMLKKNPHYREPQAEEEKKKHQLIVLTEQ
jgi:hypothetical protein